MNNGEKQKLKILCLMAVISLVLFSAGCVGQSTVGQTDVGSQQEAAQVVTDISEEVGDISNIIEDVDESLG